MIHFQLDRKESNGILKSTSLYNTQEKKKKKSTPKATEMC